MTFAKRMRRNSAVAGMAALALGLAACSGGGDAATAEGLQTDVGVDVESQVVRLGALNDESGPVAAIGTPFALGKRLLVEQVNAGDLDLLPEGWTIELVERDHGYNPSESIGAFTEIVDDVLFFLTSFGTPNTLPLAEDARDANAVLFAASLSSALSGIEHTPPVGAPYLVEAHQAVDFAVEDGGGDLRLGVVYQLDDYGEDGLAGVRAAAEFHGIEVVAEEGVAPGETEVTATLAALQSAGATHVVLTTVPSTTGPLLGTAAALEYTPLWLGSTPAWIDVFFNPEVLPPAVYQNFRWVSSLPLWGEDLPGMAAFEEAFDQFAPVDTHEDFYVLAGYVGGLPAIEALGRALEAGDVTRAGYLAALHSIDDYDANGLFPQPLDLTTVPYEMVTDTRVLAPGEDLRSWQVVRDFSTPESYRAP